MSIPPSASFAASYAVFAAAVPDLAFSYSPFAVFMFTSAAVKASWAASCPFTAAK